MKKTILFLLIILALPLAHAQISNFQLSAEEETVDICTCQEYTDTITIRNTGQYHTSYQIESDLEYVTPVTTLQVAPGEEIRVGIPISMPCGEKGVEEYDLYVYNNYGDEQVLRRDLKINKCESIEAELKAEEQIQPCQPTNYELTLTNPAPFREEYTLKPLNFKEYFSYEAHSLTLEPGQEGKINNTLHLACEYYGNQTIQYQIKSHNNDREKIYEHDLEIERSFDYDLEVERKDLVCSEGDQIRISITNNADFTNEYDLNLKNSFWFASLEDKTLEIESGETKNTYIDIRSGRGTQRNITLEVKSELGDVEKQVDLDLKRKKCDDYEVIIHSKNEYCEGTHEVVVEIKNKGAQEPHNRIGFNGQTKDINVPPGGRETYNFLIESQPEGIETKYIEANIADKWIDYKNIELYDNYECTRIEIPTTINTRYYDEEYELKLTNKGIREETYQVMINGYDQEHTIKNEKIIKIPQNKTSQDIGEHNILATIIADSTNTLYEQNITLNVRDQPLHEKADEYLRENPLVSLGIIYLFIILLLLIRISSGDKTKPRRAYTAWIIILILFIIAIIQAVILLTPQTGITEQNGSPKITFYSDINKTINLDDYFQDLDEGELTYGLVEQPIINHELRNSNLILKPQGYTGEANFSIIAIDDQGASTTSPLFYLEIIERPSHNLEDFTLLIIAILIAIPLALYALPKKK